MGISLSATRFRGDEDGSILILVALSLAAFFGFVALSFDLGRVAATQTELQSFADHVALAAAGELDRSSSAITRAEAAAAAVSDRQTFGEGTSALGSADYTLRFLKSLPAADGDPILAVHEASTPGEARYVEVTISNRRRVNMAFGAAVLALSGSGSASADVAARAVAGQTLYACDIAPMMFCIPDAPNWKADANKGQMILLRKAGPTSSWGPGNFGFLGLDGSFVDPLGACAGLNPSSGNFTRCLLGAVSRITQCIPQTSVSSDPGQSVGINRNPFNFRFDIYPQGGGPLDPQNAADFAPAPHVLKQRMPSGGGSCVRPNDPELTTTTKPSINTLKLPRDPAVTGTNRFGTAGNWVSGRAGYIAANYPLFAAAGADPFPNAKTRYDYYLAEIAANPASDPRFATSILSGGRDENIGPMCSTVGNSGPQRRVLIAAGVNCVENAIVGRAENIPVQEFVKLFITEPVGSGSEFDIWTEVVGTAEDQATGSVRRVVELVQ